MSCSSRNYLSAWHLLGAYECATSELASGQWPVDWSSCSHFIDEETEAQSLKPVLVGHTAKMGTAEPRLTFVFWLNPMMGGTGGQASMSSLFYITSLWVP